MRAVGHRESDAILGAMRQVALADGAAAQLCRYREHPRGGALPVAPRGRRRHRRPAGGRAARTWSRPARRARAGPRGSEVSRHHGAGRRRARQGKLVARAGLCARARCRSRLSHRAGRGGLRPHGLGDRRHDAQELRQRHQPILGGPRSRGLDHALRRRPGRSRRWWRATRRWARLPAEQLRQGAVGLRQEERLRLPRRPEGAQRRLRHAARFHRT